VEDETTTKVLQLLDVIYVEVAANRIDTAELRSEMRAGFDRVERRLGHVEVRVETVETDLRSLETEVRSIGTGLRSLETGVRSLETELRSFRGEFERRIVPLER
jgi:septal ring factor EnvC (AmiA/AmiB activator)